MGTRAILRRRDRPAFKRSSRVASVVLAVSLFGAGCGSSTPTGSRVTDAQAASTTTVKPLDGPVRVTGWPDDVGVNTAVLSGTTAWVLMSGPKGAASIWRFPAGGRATEVVPPAELNELYPPTISIAAWPHGLIVMGERCDKPMAAECVKDSGIVQLRDHEGKLTKTLELWRDEQTQAGGSSPRFIGLHGANAWIQGLDGIVEIDPSGKIVAKVPRADGSQPCAQAGALYEVMVKGPDLQDTNPDGSPRPFTVEDRQNLPPASISMRRWTGSEWEAVHNGNLADAGTSTELNCQGDVFTLWNSAAVDATWTIRGGWVKPPKPSEALHQSSNISGQLAPTFASNGAIYRLGDDFHLRRLDIPTGEFVDTGLILEPTTTNTKAIISLVVAESGPNLFACASRYSGLPGGPGTPGTVCGFAPVPT